MQQVSFSERGHNHTVHGQCSQTRKNKGNIAFNTDARNVGVEHMARRERHSAPLSNGVRGAAGCWRSSIKLAGIIVLASRSKNPCHESGLRDKTTSPVFESRRIKTSVPSNR